MAKKTSDNHAVQNAKSHLSSIMELCEQLSSDTLSDREKDTLREEADDWPLSVEVRDAQWHTPGKAAYDPDEYCVLLTTGGPACRIIGGLDRYKQPESAILQWQDWGTPWTDVETTADEDEALMTFASLFYYGE
jgi:hypothetical protein